MLNFNSMSIGAFFTLEQDGQKSGGAMPPSLKSGGPLAPLDPPVPPPMVKHWPIFVLFLLNVLLFEKSQPIFEKPNYPLKF